MLTYPTPPKGGGLYIIWLSDTHYYGGRTRSFRRRWRSHLRQLKAGRHANDRMQKTFNKYGQFRPEVLTRLKPSEHEEAEQEWLDTHFGKTGCVNLVPHACGGCDGHTEKTRAKMSHTRASDPELVATARATLDRNRNSIPRENMVKRAQQMTASNVGRKQAPDTIAKRAASHRGRKNTAETRAKMSEAAKRRVAEHPISHSDETKALISKQQKGRVWITDGVRNTRVFPSDLPGYLADGWSRGRTSRR